MERGAFNNLLLAHAQVWGLLLTLLSLITFIVIILTGHARLDPTTEKLVYTIMGVFLAKFGDMVAFLYNRPRKDTPAVNTEHPPAPKVAVPPPSEEVVVTSQAQPKRP